MDTSNLTTQSERWFRIMQAAYLTGNQHEIQRAAQKLQSALPRQTQGILARVGVWAADRALHSLEELR